MTPELTHPDDLGYLDDHTWVLVEGDVGTIGLTDYGQSELGTIMFVELPTPGDMVSQGSPFGTIEAMKTVSELIAPISGEVIEVNDSLENDPKLINTDPYGEGWMIRISLRDHEEVEDLMTSYEYEGMFLGNVE